MYDQFFCLRLWILSKEKYLTWRNNNGVCFKPKGGGGRQWNKTKTNEMKDFKYNDLNKESEKGQPGNGEEF